MFPILQKNEIVIISTRHPHVSISKLTKNHLKYVFIHKISFKLEVKSEKIQFKVEYFEK